MKYILFISALMAIPQSYAAELFVRPDGGTWQQCNGTVNAPYHDSVEGKACAVKHLFELLDPQEQEVRILGGDIVNILNNSDGSAAEYAMGGHGDYINGRCSPAWAYSCTAPSLPSGTALNPTILRGGGTDVCSVKPILWGTARAKAILTIDNTEHVKVSCLTITDKSSCIGASGYPDKSMICDRSSPYDKPFADTGILIKDASEVVLQDINIQGLSKGIHAGRLHNISLERVNIFANFSVGWDGDIGYLGEGESANTGTIEFKDSSINFNGCGLIYSPGQSNHNTPHACAKQDLGGYGDGLGTSATGGDWIFDNVKVMHNNSDGIDLLYHSLGGKITIKNSHIEGNAGNQIKVAGNADIINSIIIANCGWNSRQEGALGLNGENCRALGTAFSLSYTHTDTKIKLINNTVVSEGDCLVGSGNRTGVEASNQSLYIINNAFYALNDYLQDFENSCMYYTEHPFPYTQIHNNLIHKPKGYGDPCNQFQANMPTGANPGVCTTSSGPYYDNDDLSIISNPHFPEINTGVRYSSYDQATLDLESNKPYPQDIASPLVSAGYSGDIDGVSTPTTDYYGMNRGTSPDIGAIEYQAKPKAPIILEVKIIE
ncbi:MAG: hypothetical protein RPS47_17990 [Colwellia sp.]